MSRARSSLKAALIHLGISCAIALLCAGLVFAVWYPYPYREIAGGRQLFSILVAVDVVCGPLLTFILFNPIKTRRELTLDLGLVALMQLAALGYGLWSMAQARPLYLAFEGDRFRVVRRADVSLDELSQALPAYQNLHWGSPQLLGVKLLKSTDRGFIDSIEQSLVGNPPAYRPSRWVPFEGQQAVVAKNAEPLINLQKTSPKAYNTVLTWLESSQLPADDFGFLPLLGEIRSDWLVIVRKSTGMPVYFVAIEE